MYESCPRGPLHRPRGWRRGGGGRRLTEGRQYRVRRRTLVTSPPVALGVGPRSGIARDVYVCLWVAASVDLTLVSYIVSGYFIWSVIIKDVN